MNDHELCKYIKDNYDVEKDQSIVLVIEFNPKLQFKEYHFTSEREENIFVLGHSLDTVFAIIKYFNNEKVFCIQGRNYLGSENLITGEIYEWRMIPKAPGEMTPEKVKKDLVKLIKFLKKQAS